MDRDEANHTLEEARTKLTAALRGRNRLSAKAKQINMYTNSSKYEDLMVEILAYDELIKTLEERMREAQERLDR